MRERSWRWLTIGVASLFVAVATMSATDVAPGAAGAPEVVVAGPIGQKLDQHLSRLEKEGFAGAVLVAKDDKVILHKAYGLADRQRHIPNTTETVFDIGSITKQFTAAAIMKLEAAGKLSTSDPITKYFDNVPPERSKITLHHLLTHSAGLDHAYGEDTEVAPRDATVQLILSKPLLTAPGTTYRYSNPGFSLLAAIVEKVSGQPWERFLSDSFFKPAGMTKTGYRLPTWKPEEISHNYAKGVDSGPPLDRSWAPDGPYWHLFGNGGILSTTGDMFRWHKALEGTSALPDSAKQKMFTGYIRTDEKGEQYYGYGWRTRKTERGTSVVCHNGGSSFGVWAAFHRFIDDKLVIVIMSNSLPVPENENEQQVNVISRIALSADPSPLASGAPVLISRSIDETFRKCVTPEPDPPASFLESEAHAAVDPRDPNNVVAAWQVASARGRAIQASASFDAGRSWAPPVTLPINACAGGPYWVLPAASDPWVSVGPDGRVYVAAIGFHPAEGPDLANAIIVVTSSDGGRTWQPPAVAAASLTPWRWHDNVAIVADSTKPGVAYIATTRYETPGYREAKFGERPASTGRPEVNIGPAAFAKTTDGGKTWSEAREVTPRVERGRVSAPQIVIDPRSNAILVVYYRADARSRALSVVRSEDGGNTWSPESDIAPWVRGPKMPERINEARVVLAEDIVRVAADKKSGTIFVASVDARATAGLQYGVSIVRSSDGGKTWLSPMTVAAPADRTAWLADVAVNEAGTVGVVYLTAALQAGKRATTPVTVALKRFVSAGGDMAAKDEQELDRFNYLWPGDYLALLTIREAFHVVYAKSNLSPLEPIPAKTALKHRNPVDVFFR